MSDEARVDWSSEGPPTFTNGVRVAAGPHHFAMVFTEFQPFPERAAAPGTIEPRERVVASLRANPEELFQMLASLAGAWNEWVLEHAKPDSVPRFQLFGARIVEQLPGTHDPVR